MSLKNLWLHLVLSYRIACLGKNLFSKIKVFCIAFSIPFRKRFNKKNPYTTHVLPLSFFGKDFSFAVTNTSDLAVLKEIFVREEYKVDLKNSPKTIVDLGSNIGASVVYFALKYPDATIYAFEPDPKNYKLLSQNILPFKNIVPYHGAISQDGKNLKLFVYGASSLSSSIRQRADNQEFVEVPSKTFDQFVAEHDITVVDFMKFDIEGAELETFRASQKRPIIAHFIGEIHEDLMGGTKEDFIQLFPGYITKVTFCYDKRYILEAHT